MNKIWCACMKVNKQNELVGFENGPRMMVMQNGTFRNGPRWRESSQRTTMGLGLLQLRSGYNNLSRNRRVSSTCGPHVFNCTQKNCRPGLRYGAALEAHNLEGISFASLRYKAVFGW